MQSLIPIINKLQDVFNTVGESKASHVLVALLINSGFPKISASKSLSDHVQVQICGSLNCRDKSVRSLPVAFAVDCTFGWLIEI
jgi:hypothetical protein